MSEDPPISHLMSGEAEELSGTIDSMPYFAMGELDSEQGVVLKDWSAQDFANIYVRFRPHLISHARKFLREESQAEEVVQDAFLYLMTALPELDSELGVLRFLKWKTKMLCLDSLRSSTSGLNASLVPLPDEVAEEPQLEASLERADDAAIIRMALAKLNPRHREALLATIYEEKSHEEVASQMGLGQNAFRQLLFRARTSFRRALIGEAEVNEKSISEILSIAARRQGNASKLVGGSLALILISFISATGSSLYPLSNVQTNVAGGESVVRQEARPLILGDRATTPEESYVVSDETQSAGRTEATDLGPYGEIKSEEVPTISVSAEDYPMTTISESDLKQQNMRETLDLEFATRMADLVVQENLIHHMNSQVLVLSSGDNLTAYIAMNLESESIVQHFSVIFESEYGTITAVPTNSTSQIEMTPNGGFAVEYVATDLLFGDLDGEFGHATVDDASIRRSGIVAKISFDTLGDITTAAFEILPRA